MGRCRRIGRHGLGDRRGVTPRAAALAGRDDVRLLIVFASARARPPRAARRDRARRRAARRLLDRRRDRHGRPGRPRRRRARARRRRASRSAPRSRRDVSTRLREAGAEVARLPGHARRRARTETLLLLTDGLAGDQQEIVRGAYDVAGAAIPLVGGCAGDDLAMEATFQLHGDQVLRDAVVAVALGSDAPLGIGVQHGWRRVGEPGARHQQRRQPRAHARRPPGARRLPRAPRRARGRPHRPRRVHALRAQPTRSGSAAAAARTTCASSARPTSRTARSACIAEVPQGAIAWFMEGDAESVLDGHRRRLRRSRSTRSTARAAARRARLRLHRPPRRARRRGHQRRGRADRRRRAAARRVAGFYTYGEIARTARHQRLPQPDARRVWRSHELRPVQLGRAATHRVPDAAGDLRGRVDGALRAGHGARGGGLRRRAGHRRARRRRGGEHRLRRAGADAGPSSGRAGEGVLCAPLDDGALAVAARRRAVQRSRRPRCCAGWRGRSRRPSARSSSCTRCALARRCSSGSRRSSARSSQRTDLDALLQAIVEGARELSATRSDRCGCSTSNDAARWRLVPPRAWTHELRAGDSTRPIDGPLPDRAAGDRRGPGAPGPARRDGDRGGHDRAGVRATARRAASLTRRLAPDPAAATAPTSARRWSRSPSTRASR